MATNKRNPGTKGMSGKIGSHVYQKNNVVRSRPDTSRREWSENQKAHLERMDKAKKWGLEVTRSAELTAYYTPLLDSWIARTGKNTVGVYQMAIKDYMNPPTIVHEKFSQDENGDILFTFNAYDEFRIVKVMITLMNQENEIVAEMEPRLNDLDLCYEYRFHLNPANTGWKLILRVFDFPGNITTREYPLPPG